MENEKLMFRCIIGFFVSGIAFLALTLLFKFEFPQAGQAILLPSFSLFGVQVRDICIADITAIFAFLMIMDSYVKSFLYVVMLIIQKYE